MSEETCVLYNDTCPICRTEIEAYRSRAQTTGAAIRFDRLDAAAAWGIDPDTAARRLHVRKNGVVLSGLEAFRALWSDLPGLGWLACVTGLPVIRPIMALAYDHIAAPLLYRAHLRRQRRAS